MTGVSKLLTNISTGVGTDITGEWQTWNGGPGDFWVWGNLGGGTVVLEAALLESASLCVCGTEITDTGVLKAGVGKFNFNHGTRIRATLINTTYPASGVYAEVN